jgi:hypothetical protein
MSDELSHTWVCLSYDYLILERMFAYFACTWADPCAAVSFLGSAKTEAVFNLQTHADRTHWSFLSGILSTMQLLPLHSLSNPTLTIPSRLCRKVHNAAQCGPTVAAHSWPDFQPGRMNQLPSSTFYPGYSGIERHSFVEPQAATWSSEQFLSESYAAQTAYSNFNRHLHSDPQLSEYSSDAVTPTSFWASVSETEPMSSENLDDANEGNVDNSIPLNYFQPPAPLWCESNPLGYSRPAPQHHHASQSQLASSTPSWLSASFERSVTHYNRADEQQLVTMEN